MLVTAASNLPTLSNDKGAVSIISDWSADPFIEIIYYPGVHGEENKIEQALDLDDAKRLNDMLSKIYNDYPNKQKWKARN